MKAKVMCMKKLVSLFLCIVLIVCFSTSVSAAYGFMDFRIGGSVFFLTGAESGGHRLLASKAQPSQIAPDRRALVAGSRTAVPGHRPAVLRREKCGIW